MAAVVYDLDIEQGATFAFSIEWREDDGSEPPAGPLIDTDPYDAYMQVRQKPGGDLYATYSSVGVNPEIQLVDGIIYVRIGANQTDALAKGGVYDLELHNRTDDTDVVRLLMGKVKLSMQVTT